MPNLFGDPGKSVNEEDKDDDTEIRVTNRILFNLKVISSSCLKSWSRWFWYNFEKAFHWSSFTFILFSKWFWIA